jgi:hypothetical protein
MLFPPFSTKLLDDGHAIVSGHLPPEFGVGCGFLSKGGQASEPELHAEEFSNKRLDGVLHVKLRRFNQITSAMTRSRSRLRRGCFGLINTAKRRSDMEVSHGSHRDRRNLRQLSHFVSR